MKFLVLVGLLALNLQTAFAKDFTCSYCEYESEEICLRNKKGRTIDTFLRMKSCQSAIKRIRGGFLCTTNFNSTRFLVNIVTGRPIYSHSSDYFSAKSCEKAVDSILQYSGFCADCDDEYYTCMYSKAGFRLDNMEYNSYKSCESSLKELSPSL